MAKFIPLIFASLMIGGLAVAELAPLSRPIKALTITAIVAAVLVWVGVPPLFPLMYGLFFSAGFILFLIWSLNLRTATPLLAALGVAPLFALDWDFVVDFSRMLDFFAPTFVLAYLGALSGALLSGAVRDSRR